MKRVAAHPIETYILERWSPRAMSGAPLPQSELDRLFEAARWAPSSGNSQPWHFVYAHRGTPAFDVLFSLLMEGNQAWCDRASVLVVVLSKTAKDDGSSQRTAQFDAGASWMALALEAHAMGLVAHGMAGVHFDKVPDALGTPKGVEPMCMVALGHKAEASVLPEKLREREQPSDRKPIESFAFEGRFPAKRDDAAPKGT